MKFDEKAFSTIKSSELRNALGSYVRSPVSGTVRTPPPSPLRGRAWGPEQATGKPDTPGAGDIQTAWASKTQDGQDEWLILEYAHPVRPNCVHIHETYNPGAVSKVAVFTPDGEERVVWSGEDPTAAGKPRGVSTIRFTVDSLTKKVKIYLDSKKIRGWNEIDAVGLEDTSGKVQWAAKAEASSTFAE